MNYYQIHVTGDIVKVIGSKVKVTHLSVASLMLLSLGAATDGVTLFLTKSDDPF